jgi:cytochrome c oxidase assembly factor CtaG
MSVHGLLTSAWDWDPWVIAACALGLLLYCLILRRRLGKRALFFFAGVGLAFLALCSPIGFLAKGYLFSAHMLQHILLVMIAPPLLLLGLPSAGKRAGPAGRTAAWEKSPWIGWLAGVGAMWFWHVPAFCSAAVSNGWVHAAQTVSLLFMGALFWRPIVGPRQADHLAPLSGIIYLFSACVACSLLGIWISFSPVTVCPIFMRPPTEHTGCMTMIRGAWGLTAAADQQIGGLLMWVPACLVYLGAILALLGRLYRGEKAAARGKGGADD